MKEGINTIVLSALIMLAGAASAKDLNVHLEALQKADPQKEALREFLIKYVDETWQFLPWDTAQAWFDDLRVEEVTNSEGAEFAFLSFQASWGAETKWISEWAYPPDLARQERVYLLIDPSSTKGRVERWGGRLASLKGCTRKMWVDQDWGRFSDDASVPPARGARVRSAMDWESHWTVAYPVGEKGWSEWEEDGEIVIGKFDTQGKRKPSAKLVFKENIAELVRFDDATLQLLGPNETLQDAIDAGKITPPKKEPKPIAPPELATYVHRSLKDLTNEELVRFMGPGEPNAAEAAIDKSQENDDAILPNDFFDLAPRAAAIALVEESRSDSHRANHELQVPAGLKKPVPEEGYLDVYHDVQGWGSPRWWALEFDREKATLYRANYQSPWTSAAWSTERARWVLEVFAWLDTIRTVQFPGAERSYRDHMPQYDDGTEMELTLVGEHGTRLHFPPLFQQRFSDEWKGPYDRAKAAGLMHFVWTTMMKRLGKGDEGPLAWQGQPSEIEVIDQSNAGKHRSILLLKSAIWLAGSGDDAEVKTLEAFGTFLGEPNAFELKYRAWQSGYKGYYEKDWKKPEDAHSREEMELFFLFSQGETQRHLGVRLRDTLQVARLKLSVRDDVEKLTALATSKGTDWELSGWAGRRLAVLQPFKKAEPKPQPKQKVTDPIGDEQQGVEPEEQRSRQLTLSFTPLAQRDWKAAAELFETLSPEEQDQVLPDLYHWLPKEDKAKNIWRNRLLALSVFDPPETGSRAYSQSRALMQLVPSHEPMLYSDHEVDDSLVTLLRALIGRDEHRRYLELLARAISYRENKGQHWELLQNAWVFARDTGKWHFSLKAAVDASLAAEDAKKANGLMWEKARPLLETGQMSWGFLFQIAYVLGPNEQLIADLTKHATTSPEEPNGLGGGWRIDYSQKGTTARFHLPRQILSVWQEPDTLTKAKLLTLLVVQQHYSSKWRPNYGPEQRAAEELPAIIKGLDDASFEELKTFMTWLEETEHELSERFRRDLSEQFNHWREMR